MNVLNWKSWFRKKGKEQERGSVSAITALGMVVFMLAAGLAIDVGHMYLTGSELQNAADASAIAGASKMDGYAGGITAAVDAALAVPNRYEFAKEVATFSRSDVRFGINANDLSNGGGYNEAAARPLANRIRFLQVTIANKSIQVPFAQLALGTNTVAFSRTAVAGFAAGCQTLCDSIVPVSVIQNPTTGAPLNVNADCPDKTQFTPGCTYSSRLDSGGAVSPGNYLVLDLIGKGGTDIGGVLGSGALGCFKPGDVVKTKTGVNSGPIRQGWNARFDDYSGGLSPTDYPPDKNIKEGITYAEYRGGQTSDQQAPSHPGKDGRRVVIIPIIDASEYNNGNDSVTIKKFGAFFLQNKVPGGTGGDIKVEFITMKVNVTECYGSTGTENQFSTPTLYK
jgi:Flp pilus assembly protein TadG